MEFSEKKTYPLEMVCLRVWPFQWKILTEIAFFLIDCFKFCFKSQSPTENWTDDLPVCKLSGVGFLTNQRYREDGGRREEHELEDRSFHFNVDDTYLYGVFDGHDGTRASDFTVQRLPAELLLGQLTG